MEYTTLKFTQMKKLTFIFGTIFLSVLGSCSDSFLEVKPKAALSNSTLQNGKGVNSLLVGAYSLLDGWATPEGAYRSYRLALTTGCMAAWHQMMLIKVLSPVTSPRFH
jgi:hypothetical protein